MGYLVFVSLWLLGNTGSCQFNNRQALQARGLLALKGIQRCLCSCTNITKVSISTTDKTRAAWVEGASKKAARQHTACQHSAPTRSLRSFQGRGYATRASGRMSKLPRCAGVFFLLLRNSLAQTLMMLQLTCAGGWLNFGR